MRFTRKPTSGGVCFELLALTPEDFTSTIYFPSVTPDLESVKRIALLCCGVTLQLKNGGVSKAKGAGAIELTTYILSSPHTRAGCNHVANYFLLSAAENDFFGDRVDLWQFKMTGVGSVARHAALSLQSYLQSVMSFPLTHKVSSTHTRVVDLRRYVLKSYVVRLPSVNRYNPPPGLASPNR
jgi:hypothetical protein